MGKVDNVYVATNTGIATDTVIVDCSPIVMEAPGILICAVFHNGSVAVNPVQSVQVDGVDMAFLASADTLLTNVSVEFWGVSIKSLASYAVANTVVAFTPGSVLNALAAVMDFQQAISSGTPSATASAQGVVSPATCDLSWNGFAANPNNTVTGPIENSLHLAMIIAHKSVTLMNLSLSAGIEVMSPQTVGSLALTFQCAIAKAYPDPAIPTTISWAESVDREWCELIVEIPPTSIVDMIRRGVVPVPQLT